MIFDENETHYMEKIHTIKNIHREVGRKRCSDRNVLWKLNMKTCTQEVFEVTEYKFGDRKCNILNS